MVLLYILSLVAGASAVCFEASIAHPLPQLDPNNAVLKQAFATINADLELVIAAPEFAGTSLSVQITSSKETLWSKHHTARERNASRPDIPEVNGDALYRIASITKTFTVLGLLYQHEAGNLSLDDPVDKYIKELKEEQQGTIPWKDITLQSLASQLSGIPRECNNIFKKCTTEQDLIHALKWGHPVFAPNTKSTYSNLAFDVLGLVLSRVANKTYEEYVQDAIFKPLGMSKSTFSLPPDSAGVIPLDPHFWDVDEGIQNPTGGIYASTNDMSEYLRYILTHYNAIATGINWINPASPSEGVHSFYGMPWEILLTDRVLENSRRSVRFITKGGGLPGYFSMIVMVPDYGLAFTILVAGENEMLQKVQDAVGKTIVRAAEKLAIQQLEKRYVGTYISIDHTLNSTITLVANENGLVVERLISNGTDALASVSNTSLIQYVQLVPTLLYQDEKKQQGENWRIVHSYKRNAREGSIWDDFCVANIDGDVYAGTSLNQLVFWNSDESGRFAEVELSAFRVNLTRTEDGAQEMLELRSLAH